MLEPTGRYGVILVTAPSQQEAETIAETLLQEGLAACVTILPVRSIYRWQGAIHNDEEWQLLIKSDLDRFADLEIKIRQIHPYEVPEIIALPIVAGSEPYLNWISQQVGQ
jgi:periplasmic divalent cation tolerance protein